MLHLTELAGGWAAAFLAQRLYRHKSIKTSYQLSYWVIVLAHQFVAADALLGWKLSRGRSVSFAADSPRDRDCGIPPTSVVEAALSAKRTCL